MRTKSGEESVGAPSSGQEMADAITNTYIGAPIACIGPEKKEGAREGRREGGWMDMSLGMGPLGKSRLVGMRREKVPGGECYA